NFLNKGEHRISRQGQVMARSQSFDKQVDRSELDDDKAVKHHHVHDPALLVLEQFALAEDVDPHLIQPALQILLQIGRLPEADEGVPAVHHVSKEVNGISRDHEKCDEVDHFQNGHGPHSFHPVLRDCTERLRRAPKVSGCNAPSHLGTVTKVKGGCSAFSKTSVCNKLYHKMSGHSFIFFSRPNETLFIVLGFPVLVEGKEKKG